LTTQKTRKLGHSQTREQPPTRECYVEVFEAEDIQHANEVLEFGRVDTAVDVGNKELEDAAEESLGHGITVGA